MYYKELYLVKRNHVTWNNSLNFYLVARKDTKDLYTSSE